MNAENIAKALKCCYPAEERFLCKYCGEYRDWEDRDYDIGLYLAEAASFEALGHTDYVTPYLICTDCAKEVKDSISDY